MSYEYNVITVPLNQKEPWKLLDEQGRLGWDLVSAILIQTLVFGTSGTEDEVRYYFKRSVNNNKVLNK